ncbi:hypothetical protein J2T56_002044 [Natronobacillus azotifigens]
MKLLKLYYLILKQVGSEYKQLGINDVQEECIDVVLVALAMDYKLSFELTPPLV